MRICEGDAVSFFVAANGFLADVRLLSAGGKSTVAQNTIAELLGKILIGQDSVIRQIVPRVELARSRLCDAEHPAGVFFLSGPTGVGKTHAVCSLAQVLHGSRDTLVRIDCGEYQLDHEVAKLIGAPPGYLGHRETHPALSQAKISAATSERSDLSIVLFDEIEKAAPSFCRLLLGILDRGLLKLGDNTNANFERSLIFLTSNVGSEEMGKYSSGGLGFAPASPNSARAGKITLGAIRRRFSPEFVNRIDEIVPFGYLDESSIGKILDIEVGLVEDRLKQRLGIVSLLLTDSGKGWLIANGTSKQYGARELKRLIQREILQRIGAIVSTIKAGDKLVADLIGGEIVVVVEPLQVVIAAGEGGTL
jgi:ATP-dependent Clp protease ATP-binding subunit ClpA